MILSTYHDDSMKENKYSTIVFEIRTSNKVCNKMYTLIATSKSVIFLVGNGVVDFARSIFGESSMGFGLKNLLVISFGKLQNLYQSGQ